MEVIQLSDETHTIFHEYTGYGYDVNKAFKPAKSHAMEAELLCTYAPKDEYGTEGNIPYIAIQIDDEVYYVIEEYQENGTIEDAICIEPIEDNDEINQENDSKKEKYEKYKTNLPEDISPNV